MPALAVTEHGNMFSSVVFHDHARAARASSRSSAARCTSRPGSRHEKSGADLGETPNHLVLLAENQRGLPEPDQAGVGRLHRGLLLQAAHRQGAARAAREGPDRLSSCLKGEVAERAARRAGAAGARGGGDVPRHPRAGQLLPRDAGPGHRGPAARQQRAAADWPATSTCRWCAPTTCTTCGASDHTPHDILLCIGTGKTVNDAERLRYHGDQFYLKTRRRDGGGLRRLPRGARRTRCAIAERCNVDLDDAENHLPNFDVPAGVHARRATSSTWCARASRSGCRGCRRSPARGPLRHTLDEYEARARLRDRHDQADAVPGLLPDRLGLHPLRARAGHPGRARAAARRPAAWWPTACGITDVDPLEYDLLFERFLNPERVSLPDIDIDFCERRRGEVIEYVTAEVRPRERRADHHVRDDEGAGGRARRRPRARHAVRGRGPRRQADPGRRST